MRRGMPATSALRTAIDLGRQPSLVEAVVAVDMALRKRLVSVDELRSYVSSHARRSGIAQLRRVVDLAEPGSESPMETRLRLLLVLAGLPQPQTQAPLYDDKGRFVGRPDLYYPAQRLGIEYDGVTHRDSLVDDNRRQNRLLDAGYRLLRFTAADIHRTPDTVVSVVARQLRLDRLERYPTLRRAFPLRSRPMSR